MKELIYYPSKEMIENIKSWLIGEAIKFKIRYDNENTYTSLIIKNEHNEKIEYNESQWKNLPKKIYVGKFHMFSSDREIIDMYRYFIMNCAYRDKNYWFEQIQDYDPNNHKFYRKKARKKIEIVVKSNLYGKLPYLPNEVLFIIFNYLI